MNDCVATAPTPGSAHAQAAPVPNAHDWTATPTSPASESQATIEYVIGSDHARRAGGRHRERDGQMVSEIRSAIATVVTFVFARGIVGITEASATTRWSMPSTRPAASTTRPIPHVPAGWK